MPQILVVADVAEETANRLVYRERVATTDLESDHFSGQLVERVGWAVRDADEIEQKESGAAPGDARPSPAHPRAGRHASSAPGRAEPPGPGKRLAED